MRCTVRKNTPLGVNFSIKKKRPGTDSVSIPGSFMVAEAGLEAVISILLYCKVCFLLQFSAVSGKFTPYILTFLSFSFFLKGKNKGKFAGIQQVVVLVTRIKMFLIFWISPLPLVGSRSKGIAYLAKMSSFILSRSA